MLPKVRNSDADWKQNLRRAKATESSWLSSRAAG
jgi:hypothetical protein